MGGKDLASTFGICCAVGRLVKGFHKLMSCKASFCLYFQAGSCLSAMLLASICSKEIINFSDLTEVRCCLRMACVLPHIIRNCCALCFVFKLDCQTQACFIVGVVGHEINFGYKCFSCLLWVVVLSSFA